MRLSGKVALITGAGSGIGATTAKLFATHGASVVVTDLARPRAEEVAAGIREAGGRSHAVELDVRSEAGWETTLASVAERWHGLDILVANAGISFAKPIADTTLEEWRAVQAVNLDGAFLGLKHSIRAMRSRGRGGSIVLVSSASGHKASPGASAYCASKGGLRLLARTAALECAGDGIRVNTVVPAGVVTPMWEAMPFFQDLVREHGVEGAWKALAGQTPLRRFATPDEIASGILYLSSDEASYVTGTDLVIDGGYTA
jgi:3(or 17)beta-hydroxysteroid dehydrogenase